MATNPLPCPTVLRLLFSYDSETGDLVWARTPASLGRRDPRGASKLGERACNSMDAYGYKRGHVMNKSVLSHRVIWAIVHGKWPDGQIDHINGVKTDNRIENLRCVPQIENARNKPIQRNNTSGYPGIYLEYGRWRVRIGGKKARKNVGKYATFEEAYAAKKEAERQRGFHENNGRPAS